MWMQQRVSNIALIHIERAYANFVLENDIERIIDIFRSVVALAETVISSSLIELPYAHGRGFKGPRGPGPRPPINRGPPTKPVIFYLSFMLVVYKTDSLTHSRKLKIF